MRKICLLLAIFLFSTVSVAAEVDHVVISEIQIEGAIATDEFVELYNPTDKPIDLKGWKLKKNTGEILNQKEGKDYNLLIFPEVLIPAHGFYLIAHANYNGEVAADERYSNKSNSIAPDNSVILYSKDGSIVDLVGFGFAKNFEMAIVLNSTPCGSIARQFDGNEIIDTDNNYNDFEHLEMPNPQNSAPNPPETDSTPPTTTANPAGGIYGSPQIVELSADEEATTFYSLDTEVAKEDFLKYSASLEISESKTLRFYSRDSADNEEEVKSEDFMIDLVPPTFPDGSILSVTAGDEEVILSWSNPAEDFEGVLILQSTVTISDIPQDGQDYSVGDSFGDTTVVFVGSGNEFSAEGLMNETKYFFKVFAFDVAKNYSSGLEISATPELEPEPQTFPTAAFGDVVINEIAWMGRKDLPNDEWIELKNTTSKTFDFDGWTLVAEDGTPSIELFTTIPTEGFYLLRRRMSDNPSFPVFWASTSTDQTYIGALENGGEHLILRDGEGNLIDEVNASSGWFAGDNSTKATMERIDSTASGSDAENWQTCWTNSGATDAAGNEIFGTPRAVNSVEPNPIPEIPPGQHGEIFLNEIVSNPETGDEWVEIVSRADGKRDISGFVFFETTGNLKIFFTVPENIEILPNEFLVFSDWGNKLNNSGDGVIFKNGEIEIDSANFEKMEKGESWARFEDGFEITTEITREEENRRSEPPPDPDPPTDPPSELEPEVPENLNLVINEFVPNPEGKDKNSENEWIELFNPTDDSIELTHFILNGAMIAGEITAGEFRVFTAEYSEWDPLPNSSGEVVLTNPDGEVVDSKNYSGAVEKKSFGRSAENLTEWTEFWHPTRGSANIFPEVNELPTAVITIQGSGNTSGSCSLFVNLTAEDSTDPDGDDLEFEWDFGDGSTSDEENPSGFYFSPGNYTITLIATDVLDEFSEISQTFTVSGCNSGGGGGGSTTESSNTEIANEPVFTSIPTSRVEMKITEVSFNSAADWIEIQMINDGNSGRGIDIGGFYFEVDKRIKTIPKNTKMKTGEFLLLTFKSEEKDFTKSKAGVWKIFTDRSGLTKTDEQITIRDSTGKIEDAVVWENRNGAWSRGEDSDIAEIVENGGWISAEFSDAVDSSSIKREIVIARFPNSADTDSAADWFATPFATQGKENSAPPTSASEIEFLISEVAPKNPNGDRVRLRCIDCGSEAKSLAGFFLKFGENKIFEFPAEFEISSDEEVEIVFGAAEESFSENIFYSTFHGLVGADGLLMLVDFVDETADFVGWSDRSAPPNRESDLAESEIERLAKRFADGQWNSGLSESLIDSRELSRGGSIVRLSTSIETRSLIDTNSATDFEIRAPLEPFPEIEKMAGEIRISEILPNPRGPDSAEEWFELENFGSQPVELFGWQIFIGSDSYEFEESVILAPDEFRAFRGLLSIRNSGGIFTILNADGEIVDSIEYPEIREGVAFAKNSNDEFLKTEIPTPDAANGFYQILPTNEDTDADGLSNSREAEFGTNPEKFDTDGDGFPDYFEIQHGFDPNSSKSSPENLRGYRVELATLAGSRLEHSVDKETGFFIAGAGVPGGKMRLYIHSELLIVEIPISENGSWSYALDQPLEAGNHNIFTQLVDPTGVEGVARKVLNFALTEKFTPPVFAESVRISEILPNPVGLDVEGEFIELENFGSELADLSNFHLTVGRKKFTFPENSVIPAGGFLALSRTESGLTLSNSGGLISFAWPTGRMVAELSYEKVREGIALAFDGSEFRETAILTPAAANKIHALEIHSAKKKKVQKNRNGNLSDAIQISEILANPIEKDSAGEWIEIWNSGSTAVNLGNWRIDDSAGGSNPFVIPDSIILQPGEFKIFPRPLTKIAFNNSGYEAARLFDFEGRLISEINFDSPLKGVALSFDGSEFRETTMLTPNFANEFDSQKIKGTVRFAGEKGFVIENSSGEFFVKFGEGNSALLAKALLRKGGEWKIFVENLDGNFTLKNFAAAPKLLRSQLLSSTNSPPLEKQNSAWIFALLIFTTVFFSLRFAKLREVWDLQN